MPDITEYVMEEGLKEAMTQKSGIHEKYLGETKKAADLFKHEKMRRSLTPLRTPVTSDIELGEAREIGRDLTQSYDKSPYTNRNVKRAK